MSRFYRVQVDVYDYDPAKAAQIRQEAERQWPFEADDWTFTSADYEYQPTEVFRGKPATGMHNAAEGNLGSAETENHFAERLSMAIWRANGGYCRVELDANYIPSSPDTTLSLNKADYERLTLEKEARRACTEEQREAFATQKEKT